MKLENLERATTVCIEYHRLLGNQTKVDQLTEDLRRIETKRFDNETQYNGLYMGQEKETFGGNEEIT